MEPRNFAVGSTVKVCVKNAEIAYVQQYDSLMLTRILTHSHQADVLSTSMSGVLMASKINGVMEYLTTTRGGTLLGWTDKPSVSCAWDISYLANDLWRQFIPSDIKYAYWVPSDAGIIYTAVTHGTVATPTQLQGMSCRGKHCPAPFNAYASPNQADGSYLCYSCRQLPTYMR